MQRHMNAIFISAESVVVIIVKALEIHIDIPSNKQAHKLTDIIFKVDVDRQTGSQRDKHTDILTKR